MLFSYFITSPCILTAEKWGFITRYTPHVYYRETSYILTMSKEEQEAAMELLRRNAIRTPNRYEGIKAVEALAAYSKEAIPKLLEVSDNTSLAEPSVKQAAKSEIDRIKKEAKS
jgi:hypothetical protein